MKTIRTNTLAVLALSFGLPLVLSPAIPIAHAAVVGGEIRSQLPGFASLQLPDNGLRITDKELTTELSGPLKTFAKESKIALRATEVVHWTEGDSSTRDMLMYTLKGAGYDYKQLGETTKDEATMTIFTAHRTDNTAAGYWIARKGQITLVWGCSGSADAPKPAAHKEVFPDTSAENPTKPAPRADDTSSSGKPGTKISVPASLIGAKWSWTTIGGVNYVNQNGQMMDPSGMSASYTFTKDGRYKFFFYVRQRTYNMVTESTTNHQGKVTFSGDNTFTVYPEQGTYKGNIGSRLIDRPMTAEERKPVTWYYEWRTENGKRLLYIGPDKSSARSFKQD